ncbi:hypothetical protein [Amycolatopsis sp. NPDC051903]|uniref:hypothetical protein n=1 Tax=Amycolatopsis sp. NPDC051903 TaxID=3363936 RepID=UPI0037AC8A97
MLGDATRRQGRYLAFNKAIAQEAGRKFGRNVQCSTAHALAYRAGGHVFAERMDQPRAAIARLAKLTGITMDVTIGERELKSSTLCYLRKETVLRDCYSADEGITREHVPWPRGIADEHQHDQLAEPLVVLGH